ncbi:transcriptional regulator, MarR family [Renibacterium salmoninarum ATCC 33209]|uniref:Transcriptional regulator, MarR family n=1 Tax=Renibacterium salmoninarum (strain ATCC 33209 / DSM 20767 / JCM 11484 / NBRC 15589 / NCIMB 2235) TaxID=288705 RepID=A9WNX9_RENSM|nr:transcriptional regulator, MarR family [Renibacterium salmoninarum ATCC 33209]
MLVSTVNLRAMLSSCQTRTGGQLLTTAARLVEHDWNERLASIGVTHAGIIALDVLASRGPMSQAKLASWARVQAQTMGKTLSRLELRGHIQRIRSTEDRRSQLVSLTAEGQRFWGKRKKWNVACWTTPVWTMLTCEICCVRSSPIWVNLNYRMPTQFAHEPEFAS